MEPVMETGKRNKRSRFEDDPPVTLNPVQQVGWDDVNLPAAAALEEGEEVVSIEEGEDESISGKHLKVESSSFSAAISSSFVDSSAAEAKKQKLLQWKLKKGLGVATSATSIVDTQSSSIPKKVVILLGPAKSGGLVSGSSISKTINRKTIMNDNSEEEEEDDDNLKQSLHDTERLRQRALLSFLDTNTSSTSSSAQAEVEDRLNGLPSASDDQGDALESFMNVLSEKAPPTVLESIRQRDNVISLDDIVTSDMDMGDISTDSKINTDTKHRNPQTNNDNDDGNDDMYHTLFQQALLIKKQIDGESQVITNSAQGSKTENKTNNSMGEFIADDVNDVNDDDDDDDDDIAMYERSEKGDAGVLEALRAKMAKKEIKPIDHATVDYLPFRKSFYIEPKSIAGLSQAALDELRDDLEIKVRGHKVPRPISTWEESGLPDRLLSILEAKEFKAPFSIQRQALPALMSGHDLIGVARTGSGKTLAYLLPLFRQVLDQPPLKEGDGPIALILAPSRELVVQIAQEAKKLAKGLGLRVVAIYGGASVSDQIGLIKRGAEVIVCTPGRMIDILTLNSGRLTSFKRVTYVVLDEADRLYDMGFEPQISRILSLVRPDRQICMFSATFPSHVETLARKVLKHSPIEIVVGGRSKASPLIDQHAELFATETEKFNRLLQLLGDWYEEGNIIIFCDTKENVDWLFTDLLRAGYSVLTLHGGKDQSERESSIADFKAGIKTVLVATSVAGRGLDVRNLVLVINYSCPNHLEDYVHRVGRTGRAGSKGTAYTFLTPDDESYAVDIVRALKDAKQEDHIPKEITALAQHHREQVAAGIAKKRHSGFSGASGYKFDGSELSEAAKTKNAQRLQFEIESGALPEDVLGLVAETLPPTENVQGEKVIKSYPQTETTNGPTNLAQETTDSQGVPQGQGITLDASPNSSSVTSSTSTTSTSSIIASSSAAAALAIASTLSGLARAAQSSTSGKTSVKDELDINDYPQQARRKLMVDTIKRIEEWTGTAITGRGIFVLPGRQPPPGESRLHLLFEAPTEAAVRKAKSECLRILEEETKRVGTHANQGAYGKFTV